MEARELIAGNYYQDENGNIEKLDTFEVNFGVLEYPNGFKPIPLTQEWLVNFGAERVKQKSGVIACYKLHGIKFEVSNSGNVYHSQTRKLIPYVHKLQNFMYELKDVELELKQPI